MPKEALVGVQVVINLAGESIVGKRWSKSYKESLRNSRIQTSQALVQTILSLDKKPELVIQASAVGYYGMENRKEICSEQSAPGKDFLAGLCVAWEKQLEPLQKHMRVCTPRLGVVLGWGGGLSLNFGSFMLMALVLNFRMVSNG